MDITCQLQYFLKEDSIGELHDRFDVDYEHIIENNALNALKVDKTRFRLFLSARGQTLDVRMSIPVQKE